MIVTWMGMGVWCEDQTKPAHEPPPPRDAGEGATIATVSAINAAALELADTVARILQANSDYFEGNYPVSEPWPKGTETHRGSASTIELTLL